MSESTIFCPHCGLDNRRFWEIRHKDEPSDLHDCHGCKKTFFVCQQTAYSFEVSTVEAALEAGDIWEEDCFWYETE